MSDPTPAPPLPAPDLWETVDRLHGWLDSHRRHPARETLLLRMLKLSEEVGEVARAFEAALAEAAGAAGRIKSDGGPADT